jgi:isoleucyl-tRNA synthetase
MFYQKLGKGKGKDKEEGRYSKSVNLPLTEFNQRANSVTREPELQKYWEDNQVYQKAFENNKGSKFVLHDGPPYANGDLHIGHALNKILKDFINRLMQMAQTHTYTETCITRILFRIPTVHIFRERK